MLEFNNLAKVMQEYSMYLLDAAKENLPDDYAIRDNMEFIFETDGMCYDINFKAPAYWVYVQNGRGPGRFPPVSKIEEWIEVKKITPYPDAKGKLPTRKQLAFLIARSIARDGTKATPTFFLSRALDKDNDYWNDRIEEAVYQDVIDNLSYILKFR